jgi:uncharacterized membrane protein YphA (DoxX/SURF4 family)
VAAWLPPDVHQPAEVSGQRAALLAPGWFHFWIRLQSSAPSLFATLTGVAETAQALVLLLGVARRVGYALGAVYTVSSLGSQDTPPATQETPATPDGRSTGDARDLQDLDARER